MGIKHLSATGTAGNANCDFVVPSNAAYRVLYGHVNLTTDATVASRYVTLSVLNAAGTVVFDVHAGANVAASQTAQHHEFMQGIYRETAFVNDALQVPMGQDMILPTGWTLRISVSAGVAGDSFDTSFVVEEM